MNGFALAAGVMVVGLASLVYLGLVADEMKRHAAILSARQRAWLRRRDEQAAAEEPIITATYEEEDSEDTEQDAA